MKTAVAIRHLSFENLGSWESILKHSYDIRYIEAPLGDIKSLNSETIDLLIILGGPIGVYDHLHYPFIDDELKLLENRFKKNAPTLGICLGSQVMAKALGAKVYPNHIKEIGWDSLILTEEGEKDVVNFLSQEHTSMFHWHGDTFDLPLGATLLASTKNCRNQIYKWGSNTLAFQCHPEVTAEQLEYWWVGHAAELQQQALDVNYLRIESQRLAPQLQQQSQKCLQEWLKNLQAS